MPGEGGEAHTPRLTLTTVLALSLPVSHSLSRSSPTRWAPSGEKGGWYGAWNIVSHPSPIVQSRLCNNKLAET